METTKKATSASKTSHPFTVSKRHSMPVHEALLLTIQECLPNLLAEELQNAEPLNEFIRANAEKWKERIENLIIAKGLKGSEAKTWRGVPNLSFATGELDTPAIELGATLTKTIDSPRNSRGWAPILVADFALKVKIPRWSNFFLHDGKGSAYPEIPISKPSEGLSISQRILNVPIFGQVFPTSCPLGEVAIEMARLVDAVGLHLADDPEYRFSDSKRHVLLVTDSLSIFEALNAQYDAVCFPQDENRMLWTFENIQTFHTAEAYGY